LTGKEHGSGFQLKLRVALHGKPSQSYGASPYGITQCYLPPSKW